LITKVRELEEKYKVSTITHSIDFAKADDAAYDAFSTAIDADSKDIGVLGVLFYFIFYSIDRKLSMCSHSVNNVGKSHNMPAYLIDTPKDEIKDIVSINVDATLRVTYAVLPGMVKR
jgi:17beta-estradiol 17-dehydrogenase / very-long-chain 3-oxoacyl-CoA reductase